MFYRRLANFLSTAVTAASLFSFSQRLAYLHLQIHTNTKTNTNTKYKNILLVGNFLYIVAVTAAACAPFSQHLHCLHHANTNSKGQRVCQQNYIFSLSFASKSPSLHYIFGLSCVGKHFILSHVYVKQHHSVSQNSGDALNGFCRYGWYGPWHQDMVGWQAGMACVLLLEAAFLIHAYPA